MAEKSKPRTFIAVPTHGGHTWLVAATLGRTDTLGFHQHRERRWLALLWVSPGACSLFLEEPPLSADKDSGLCTKISHPMSSLWEKWGRFGPPHYPWQPTHSLRAPHPRFTRASSFLLVLQGKKIFGTQNL